jgi:hypothetical protein
MDVDWMLDELAALGVFKGIRGSAPWDRAAFAHVLEVTNRVATGSVSWLETLDINPLGLCDCRLVVVDALLTMKSDEPRVGHQGKEETMEFA